MRNKNHLSIQKSNYLTKICTVGQHNMKHQRAGFEEQETKAIDLVIANKMFDEE